MIEQSNPASASRRKRRACLAAALALSTAAAISASGQATTPGIENFGKVNDNYYRGAQPTAAQYAELGRAGVKTVIDLRKDRKAGARDLARAAGLSYFNLPLEASRPATVEQAGEFLRLVNDPANWPVYVHCDRGRTRTGALTAAYRITNDGWTAGRALGEMLKYGFDGGGTDTVPGGGGRARQERFVYAFYERHASAQDPARDN